jgi:hypothetical protein
MDFRHHGHPRLADFCDAVENDDEPQASGREALRTQTLSEGLRQSPQARR